MFYIYYSSNFNLWFEFFNIVVKCHKQLVDVSTIEVYHHHYYYVIFLVCIYGEIACSRPCLTEC